MSARNARGNRSAAPAANAAPAAHAVPGRPAPLKAPPSDKKTGLRALLWPIIVFLGLATVPSIYSGLLTSSFSNPSGHFDRIPAAVVNADEPVTVRGTTVDIGTELTDELVHSTANNNFNWREMPTDEAQDALETGRVLAVLTIPREFSADASSTATDSPQRAQLRVTTNDATSMFTGTIATSIGTAVADELSATVSTEFFRNIAASFTDIHGQLNEASDGASALSDGAAQARGGAGDLQVGLDRLVTGSGDLAAGVGDLEIGAATAASGAANLNDGAARLVDGAAAARDGATQLRGGTADLANGAAAARDGAATLGDGTAQLTDGAAQASDGAATLAAGTTQLRAQTRELPAQARALNDGATQLADGSTQLATGASSLADGAAQVADGTAQLTGLVDAAAADAKTVQDAVAQLQTPAAHDGAAQVSAGLRELLNNWGDLSDAERQAALADVQQGAQAVQDALDAAGETLQGLNLKALEALQDPAKLVGQVHQLNDGAQQVAAGADNLVDGASSLRDGAARLADGTGQLAASAPQLSDAIGQIDDGAARLAGANAQLADGASRVNAGAGDLAAGTSALADGASRVAAGAGDLATGTDTLADGASALHDGTGQLADGTRALADGTVQLRDGADQLADGTRQAADGTSQLRTGLGQLVDGSGQLRDGLADGADQVPAYSDTEASHLADVASRPVNLDEQRLFAVELNGDGMAPYFMSLALWVGGMAYFMMHQPLRRLRGRGSLLADLGRAMLPSSIMGVVQSALMLTVVHFWAGVDYGLLWPLCGMVLLASMTFVALNQAIVALLGPPGRYLALVLIVLQLSSAGATYPVQTTPMLFQWLHPWLPISHSVDAFRALIAGSTVNVGPAVSSLVLWFAIAVALLLLALIRKRGQDARTAPTHPAAPAHLTHAAAA